jgi:hypothetical protein
MAFAAVPPSQQTPDGHFVSAESPTFVIFFGPQGLIRRPVGIEASPPGPFFRIEKFIGEARQAAGAGSGRACHPGNSILGWP